MGKINYLSARDIVHIHNILVEETGGSHGIRDREMLLSVEALPQQRIAGQEMYSGIYEKAAVYFRNIVMGHPFVDGNKRTGVTCAIVFLEDNEYIFDAPKGEIERFTLKVVKEKLDLEDIARWLEKHARKINNG